MSLVIVFVFDQIFQTNELRLPMNFHIRCSGILRHRLEVGAKLHLSIEKLQLSYNVVYFVYWPFFHGANVRSIPS